MHAMSASAASPGAPRAFGAVVPVKPSCVAKSRLSPLGDRARVALAEAFAADTVAAVLECPLVQSVLVVTDDRGVAEALEALGAEVVPDGLGDDLNGSLVQGAAELARRRPELRPVVVCADLPALRPDQLATALASMPTDRMGIVADAAGEGTTVLAAPWPGSLEPRFGPGSRKAHLDAAAGEVDRADIPGVRRDVDTPADLVDAAQLGVGPRTASVLAGIPSAGRLRRPVPQVRAPG
jgi:2-phospho-L-lactate guanylyltransferase